MDGNEDSDKILDRKQVPYYPEWFLRQVSQSGLSTNYLDVPDLVFTYCNIYNERRYGPEDWDRALAAKNVGVYGHVVPVSNAILVQYWMFYGWSSADAPFNIADHEGEWELFEVELDPNEPQNVNMMKRAAWYAHGGGPSQWDPAHGSLPILASGATLLGTLPTMPQAHPPVYVESGSHGSWPAFVDNGIPGTGKNRGNGHSYTPQNVTNVGEAYRPRLGTEVILQFNGRWGAFSRFNASPEGPVLQSQWRHSPGSNSSAIYVGQWNAGPDDSYRNGRISWPWNSVETAISAASDSQTVLIYPGSYSGGGVISKPVTLKAPHGNVTIGR